MINKILMVFLSISSALSSSTSFAQNNECLIVGHRGSSRTAPENTVVAAKLAWEQGADAVEIDVHLSGDNQVVVIHDKGTKRTSGVDHLVRETDYATLKELDVGSWKSAEYAGEGIPLLEDIISIIPEGRKLVVEIKSDKKIVPYIEKSFSNHDKVDQLIFIAFDYETILAAKKAFPQNKSFWLSSSFKDDVRTVLSKVKNDGLDGVDLNYRMVKPQLIEVANSLQLEVHTWTVNNPEKGKELKAMGVKSITTDIPDVMLETINSN